MGAYRNDLEATQYLNEHLEQDIAQLLDEVTRLRGEKARLQLIITDLLRSTDANELVLHNQQLRKQLWKLRDENRSLREEPERVIDLQVKQHTMGITTFFVCILTLMIALTMWRT